MACGQLRIVSDEPGAEPDPEDQVEEAAAALGIRIESTLELEDEFYLWPENEPVFRLWQAVSTQWVVSDGVKRSLNYPGVKVVLDYAVPKRDRAEFFAGLQLMERACLSEWARNRK